MSIKIENRSNDDIIIVFNGKSVEIPNSEDYSFENVENKSFSLSVQRKRILKEYAEPKHKKKFSIYEDENKPLSHIQLKGEFEIESISSHAVICVEENISAFDTLHEDVLFVGYKLSLSGAKQLKADESFANSEVKKSYVTAQVKNAVLPVGLVGVIVTIVGVYCLINALNGNSIKFYKNELDTLTCSVLSVGGVAILSVFVSNLIKIFKRVKELS